MSLGIFLILSPSWYWAFCPIPPVCHGLDTKDYLWRVEENTRFVTSSSSLSPCSSFDWFINWVGCGDPSQLLLGKWIWQWNIGHMGIGYSAGSFVGLSCQDQPFSCTSEGRYLGGGGCCWAPAFVFSHELYWAGSWSIIAVWIYHIQEIGGPRCLLRMISTFGIF